MKSITSKYVCFGLVILAVLVQPRDSYAQVEIDFGSYVSSTPLVTAVQDLNFGSIFKPGSASITLGSGLEGVVSMEGIQFLDAFVTISPYPVILYLNGNTGCAQTSCQMTFNMFTAYTNAGQLSGVTSGAVVFTGSTVRFPFRARAGGPPRPPPVPPHAGYTPPTETAYLYIYGDVSATIDNQAGSYSNVITITVAYD